MLAHYKLIALSLVQYTGPTTLFHVSNGVKTVWTYFCTWPGSRIRCQDIMLLVSLVHRELMLWGRNRAVSRPETVVTSMTHTVGTMHLFQCWSQAPSPKLDLLLHLLNPLTILGCTWSTSPKLIWIHPSPRIHYWGVWVSGEPIIQNYSNLIYKLRAWVQYKNKCIKP